MTSPVELMAYVREQLPLLLCGSDGSIRETTALGQKACRQLGFDVGQPLPQDLLLCVRHAVRGQPTEWYPLRGRGVALVVFEAGADLLILLQPSPRDLPLERQFERQRLEITGRLVTSIVQELRGGVASVLYNADLSRAQRVPISVPEAETLRDMRSSCGRLQQCADRLLEFADASPLGRSEVAVAEVFGRSAAMTQALFRAGGHGLEQYIGPDAGRVTTNPVLLQQILVSLLINAAEAGQGRRHVRLSSERGALLDSRGTLLQIAVEDDGPGVPEVLSEHIFQPFFTTKPGSAGVGLSTARIAARAAGGVLELEPTSMGARFVLRLLSGDASA